MNKDEKKLIRFVVLGTAAISGTFGLMSTAVVGIIAYLTLLELDDGDC